MSKLRAAYLDEAGRPRLRHSIVAFIDVLGFSHIATSCASLEDSQRVLDRIAAAIEDSRDFVRQPIPDGDAAPGSRWATKFFSDNLAFGYPFDPTEDPATTAWFIIRCAQRYQLKMTMNGFFVRGALTQGPVCLTDEIIFGSALIECYQLESKASIVPRVVLAEPLQELVTNSYRASAGQVGPDVNQSICRDVDGLWFVNYLDAAQDGGGIIQWQFIEQHKASILESLSHTTRHDVLPKFGWACRYHNVFCHWHRDDPGYSDRYRIDRADEQSTIYRLSDTTKHAP
jgi:hypothetical protein